MLHVDSSNIATFGKALAIFDDDEAEDLLTASASGTPKFRVDQAGKIYAGTLTTTSTTAICHTDTVYNGVTFKELTDCDGAAGDIAEWYPVRDSVTENGEKL